ncbi:helix-turn-helix domain-containing protein [Nocardioides convexus]|uniref:TetR/AcrR family transcriptional regulator n=1 Tax=Nocardioides convexus TaxID=2712224 RepID=UPI00241861D3|nr:helix-turn-helix domain-containing protein [Nocardioides convexus]
MALAPPSRASRNKREQILEAAERLFAAAGYERVSVDAIAAESGVSKPTVYSHFGGKEGLYRASLARAALAMNQRFARVLPGITASAQWRDALTTAGVSLVQCQRSPESIALSRQPADRVAA